MSYRIVTVHGKPFEGKGLFLSIDLNKKQKPETEKYLKGWVRDFFYHAEIKRDVAYKGYNRAFDIRGNTKGFEVKRVSFALWEMREDDRLTFEPEIPGEPR